MKRVLTAVVLLPILLYTVWNDAPYLFIGITAVAIVVGLREFYMMAAAVNCRAHTAAGYGAALLVVWAFATDRAQLTVATLAALVLVSLALSVFAEPDLAKALGSVAATVFGVVYVAILAGFLIGVRVIPDTFVSSPVPHLAAKLMTTYFAMVMMTDTGAYYVGRALGRHKLAPRVSPGKTIEGSIGGFCAAALAGLACHYTFFPEIPAAHAAVLGAIIGVVSQVGDLAESLLKRGAGVKDSGTIFPGHGGMLDRLDSLLFCAPLIFYYARLLFPR